jgi:hypothetical protein
MWIFVLTASIVAWIFIRNSKKRNGQLTSGNQNFPTISPPPPTTKQTNFQGKKIKQMYIDRFPAFYALLDWYLGRYSPLKDYVFAQAMFESAQFSSNIYKNTNNPFGMGVPKKRPSKRIGEYNGFSKYKDDAQAIQDFKEYLIYFNYPTNFANVGQYVDFLHSKKYFEAPLTTYKIGMSKFFE